MIRWDAPELAQSLFREANDAFLLVDVIDHRIVDANPMAQRLSGHRRDALLKQELHDLVSCASLGAIAMQRLKAAYQGGHEFHAQEGYLLCHAAGLKVPVSISVSQITHGEDTVGLVILRDISERIDAHRNNLELLEHHHQLQKLESLGLMAGGIAHDFNNLFVAILGFAELIQEELPAGSSREHLNRIIASTSRASEITRQLHAYAGRPCYEFKPINLSDLLAEMESLLTITSPKNIRLVYELDPVLPQIQGDTLQLRQAILNLVENAAASYDGADGEIILTTGVTRPKANGHYAGASNFLEHDGDFAYVRVEDWGKGIAVDQLRRIFDPFFAIRSKGRGLGLAAATGTIRSHKGAIQVESQPEQGSTFTILLPCMARPSGNDSVHRDQQLT